MWLAAAWEVVPDMSFVFMIGPEARTRSYVANGSALTTGSASNRASGSPRLAPAFR
jgi:hypothetical protein